MKKYIKKIVLVISMVFVSFSLTACGDVKVADILANMIKLIDANSNTAGDIDNIIIDKWTQYDNVMNGLENAGLIKEGSINNLKTALNTSKEKMKKAFVTNTSGTADEEIAKHILWFRTPMSFIKIYNQMSLNHIVAQIKDGQGRDNYQTSPNVGKLNSKYGIEDENNINNCLVKMQVIADLKVDNHKIFNNVSEWNETKVYENTDTASGSGESPVVPEYHPEYFANYTNEDLYCYRTWTTEHVSRGGHTQENPECACTWTASRFYEAYKRGECKLAVSESDLVTAIEGNKGSIVPIYKDSDIANAIKGNATETGYRTLKGDGTNTGSNDIDINVDKFTYAIDGSNMKAIEEVSQYFDDYDKANGNDGRREVGKKIYESGVYVYEGVGQSDNVYETTNYSGYNQRLEEDYILSRLAKRGGSVDANATGKDFVITLGGVPIIGIRLNEISSNVMSIIGEGVMAEMDDGYVAIDYIKKDSNGSDLARRGLFPTQLYVSFINEIDANGNFNFDTSEALYNLKDKMFKQKGSGITDADGKVLAEKYDIQRSFIPIKNEDLNKLTLLCLQYFGLFRNDKVVDGQWFPIGRSFVFDRQVVLPSQKKIKDLTSRIGWWENANGEWDKSSANGLYLSDLCDQESYDSNNLIYVLEKGDEDSTESYLGKGSKNNKSQAELSTTNFSIETDSTGKKYFRYKASNGTNYLYDGWFKLDGTSYKFNSQGYWENNADVSSSTNVIGISGDAWHNPLKDSTNPPANVDEYWYYGSANALLWVTEGTYKYNGTTYKVGADGYIESETTASGGFNTASADTIINSALDKLSKYYVEKVAVYDQNSSGVAYTHYADAKLMPTCSGFASAFMKECIANLNGGDWKDFNIGTGTDFTRFTTYNFNNKTNLQNAGIFTYFDYYSGTEMAGITLKKGDILVTDYVNNQGHTEIYIDSSHKMGWGKVQTQMPQNCTWNTSKQNEGKITGAGYTFTKLLRFKGRVN